MRKKVSYSLLVLIPALTAVIAAPVAAADPPVCTGGQTPDVAQCILDRVAPRAPEDEFPGFFETDPGAPPPVR
jgi:hypothetical protein